MWCPVGKINHRCVSRSTGWRFPRAGSYARLRRFCYSVSWCRTAADPDPMATSAARTVAGIPCTLSLIQER
jgi:hypothetical protein